MTSEEYKWKVNLVKDRYHQFSVSFRQAEKIYEFEQEKDLHSDEYHFSAWEEFDYMLDNFQKILNEKQLKKFTKWHIDNIKKHEQYLVESDNEQIKYIDYYTELLDFYQQQYFPAFFKERFLIQTVSLSSDKSKVEFLKSEYKAFLDSQRVGHISSHYRHSRLFQPNQLKVTLLRHKIKYIIPRYSLFKTKMDKPTKATVEYLLDKFHFIPERHSKFFTKMTEEVTDFVRGITVKYIGEPKGYVATNTETEQEKRDNQIMTVILLDIEKYGC